MGLSTRKEPLKYTAMDKAHPTPKKAPAPMGARILHAVFWPVIVLTAVAVFGSMASDIFGDARTVPKTRWCMRRRLDLRQSLKETSLRVGSQPAHTETMHWKKALAVWRGRWENAQTLCNDIPMPQNLNVSPQPSWQALGQAADALAAAFASQDQAWELMDRIGKEN